MIAGLGIDLIEVDRISEKIGKESGFREMVFSDAEIRYCEARPNKFEHYAARFAAKEAFLKAMGSGWNNGTEFREIEITNDDLGKPTITLNGLTAKTFEQRGFKRVAVTLTHIKLAASAVVIIEN